MDAFGTGEKMELDSIGASYRTSHYYIRINTDRDPVDAINDSDNVFIHEYIHFIQDMILPYCFRNSMFIAKKAESIKLDANISGDLERPFSNWSDDCKTVEEQVTKTWGSKSRTNNRPITDIERTEEKTEYGFNLYKYIIKIDNLYNYHFGARDLLEFIAFTIDNKIQPEEFNDYPYKTVLRYLEYIGLTTEDYCLESIIALVEYSLIYDDPVNTFILNLKQIISENKGLLVDHLKLVEILKTIKRKTRNGYEETIDEKYNRRLTGYIKFMEFLYGNENYKTVISWLKDSLDYFKKDACQFLFYQLYINDTKYIYKYINNCIKDIGFPLVINNNYKISSFAPEKYDANSFLLFYATHSFIYYAQIEQDKCPMYEICQYNSPSILNNRCTEAPLQRKKESKLCQFSVVNQYLTGI